MADLDAIADRLDIIDLCQRPHWIHDHDLWDEFDDLYTETVSMPTAAQATAADFDVTTYLDHFHVAHAQLKRGMMSFKAGLLTALKAAVSEYGTSVLLVEQHIEQALATADRAYIMVHGSIVRAEDASFLREHPEVIEESYLGVARA